MALVFEYSAIAASASLLLIYNVVALYSPRTNLRTMYSIDSIWGRKHVKLGAVAEVTLAIQTLRNSVLVAVFVGTASFSAMTSTLTSLAAAPPASPLWVNQLIAALLAGGAFLSFAVCIRCAAHAGYLVGGASFLETDMGRHLPVDLASASVRATSEREVVPDAEAAARHMLGLVHMQARSFAARYGVGALKERVVRDLAAIRSLNAFVDERILEPIKGSESGVLHGVPVAIKANICVEGTLTTAASKMLKGHRPSYTATAVERLQSSGAMIVGSTNMDEFGMGNSTSFSAHGSTCNPYSKSFTGGLFEKANWLTPGGSSGGSAVAVATGAVAAALGSDTGGSVRQPASFCGIVGFKPSYGRIPRHGLIAYASSLDTIGVFACTVNDVKQLYDVVAGPDPADDTSLTAQAKQPISLFSEMSAPRNAIGGTSSRSPSRADFQSTDLTGLRVGCPCELRALPRLAPDVRRAWDVAAAALQSAGAEIVNVSMPSLLHNALPAYYIIAAAEAASNLSRYDGLRYGGDRAPASQGSNVLSFRESTELLRSSCFGNEVQRRILTGNLVLSREGRGAFYNAAEAVRARVTDDFHDAFSRVDIILTPVSPIHPWRSAASASLDPAVLYEADVMTIPASLAGLPAISLPILLSNEGVGGPDEPVPIAAQLVGRVADESTVLGVAAVLETLAAFPTPEWRLRYSNHGA